MAILGLDVGTKTIGIAKAEAGVMIATGMTTLKRANLEKDFQRLREIIAAYDVDRIVVGLPRNMDGSLGPWGREVEQFSQKLKETTGVEVVLWDERLSTVAAERVLIEADVSRKKRREVLNTQAAIIILQNYLDSLRFNAE